MRILQIVQKPQRRGPEILARQLNQAFRQRGHDTGLIYLYHYDGERPLPLDDAAVTLEGHETHFAEKMPGVHPGLLWRLAQQIVEFRPDVIQLNGSRSVKYGAFVRYTNSKPHWVLIYRNIGNPAYWAQDRFHVFLYQRLVMARMDGVIGVSENLLEDVQRMYQLEVPSVVIPYVVDPERLRPTMTLEEARKWLGMSLDVPIVLYMGSLSEEKRPDRFLQIVSTVRKQIPDIQAWMLGSGALRLEVERLAQELDLERTVRLWGYQESVSPFIAASDLLLITSDTEGVPTVIQEAGYLGKPTVSTRVGGIPECVVDGETGLLFDRDDEQGLSQGVVSLLKDPNRRIAMGDRAQRLVRKQFTLDKVVDRHLDFYSLVLSSRTQNRFPLPHP